MFQEFRKQTVLVTGRVRSSLHLCAPAVPNVFICTVVRWRDASRLSKSGVARPIGMSISRRCVVIGGGVAGVCCAEEILRLRPTAHVTIVTPEGVLKGINGITQISKHTEELSVKERPASSFVTTQSQVVHASVTGLDTVRNLVHTSTGSSVPYDRLCICTGASPKVVADSKHVLVLRDRDTVSDLQARLPSARRTVLIGNGGIALELAHAMRGMEVVWVMRQGHMGDAFFDVDAASFLLTELNVEQTATDQQCPQSMPMCTSHPEPGSSSPTNSSVCTSPRLDAPQLEKKSPLLGAQPCSSNKISPGSAAPMVLASQAPLAATDADGAALSAAHQAPAGDNAAAHSSILTSARTRNGAAGPQPSAGESRDRVQNSAGARTPEERRQHGPTSAVLDRLKEAAPPAGPSYFAMVQGRKNAAFGHAVGPRWSEALSMHAARDGHIVFERNCEVDRLVSAHEAEAQGFSDRQKWPVHVRLTNGKVHGADLVISAIGVLPNVSWLPEEIAIDEGTQGIQVDREMRTTATNVWAAGDCCTVQWPDRSQHWFQMRIWTQARLMGMYAAHCMAGNPAEAVYAFNFELYTHVTRFMNKRVILLGLYNGQGLQEEPDRDIVTYSRATEGPEASFVRVLLLRNRMMGAVLIGDTDFEEVFENLILDRLDLSAYGPDLLSPDIDLQEVFD
ncbi:hypothetical protein WJX73_002466 [Symbiochloris irregularis]|uniref:FAD/NAD(P)-binding domain-containing protein n=1 Tax=Symbiochloris irregularis TaxID=706552 RepID=A0AAW1P143_9CHLO